MMRLIFFYFLLVASYSYGQSNVLSIVINKKEVLIARKFITHNITKKNAYYTLAMDINYDMVMKARQLINHYIYGNKLSTIDGGLDYFKGFNKSGEAHITVITPCEFISCDPSKTPVLAKHVSMKEINQLAYRYKIQLSDLDFQGIGSKSIKSNTTFYYIVKSHKLLRIRRAIAKLFYSRGGTIEQFDPEVFFPHITIGYIESDIHYPKVMKDMRTYDPRFKVILR